MSVIDKLAPFKGNSHEWFDGKILESIVLRDKLFRKFNRFKLNVDKEICNKTRNTSHRLIFQQKKIDYFEKNLLNQRIFGKHLNHLAYPNLFQFFKQMQLRITYV